MSDTSSLIRVRGATKRFEAQGPAVLQSVDFDVKAGEYVAILGRSGSGKSTLLNLIAGLDRPSSGTVQVGDTAVHTLSESQLAAWRGKQVGVVFQFFQLLPTLTAVENVKLPMELASNGTPAQRQEKALELLASMGLAAHADKFPAAMSGGEQQRVAIARALANDPPILLADEPTGNLDDQNALALYDTLAQLASRGRTIVMVTHDRAERLRCTRVVPMSDLQNGAAS